MNELSHATYYLDFLFNYLTLHHNSNYSSLVQTSKMDK